MNGLEGKPSAVRKKYRRPSLSMIVCISRCFSANVGFQRRVDDLIISDFCISGREKSKPKVKDDADIFTSSFRTNSADKNVSADPLQSNYFTLESANGLHKKIFCFAEFVFLHQIFADVFFSPFLLLFRTITEETMSAKKNRVQIFFFTLRFD